MKLSYVVSLLAICLIAYSTLFAADPPRIVSYQGRVTDSGGQPIDTTADIIFAIFTDSIGGVQLWKETHFGVTVQNGLFEVLLGTSQYLTDEVLDGSTRWLGMAIDSDDLLTPLTPITSSAYAIRAEQAGYALTIADNSVTTSKVSPNGVHPSDILAEPGLAVDDSLGVGIDLDLSWTVVARSEISCPTAGYVVALSTMKGSSFAENYWQSVVFGITADSTALASDDRHQWDVPQALSSTYARVTLVAQKITEIPSAGDYVFYLIAKKQNPPNTSTGVSCVRLNLMYFPTAYGTVDCQSY